MLKIIKLSHLVTLFLIGLLLLSCEAPKQEKTDTVKTIVFLQNFIDQWHKDVADADFDAYFSKMDSTGVFIGTDASEVWSVTEFATFSKPYFDSKKTWNFKALDRHIHLNDRGDIAWFDEVLDTWMGLCRGSGILEKKHDEWKIKHYVLSVTIPNDDIKPVIEAKKTNDSIALAKYKNAK